MEPGILFGTALLIGLTHALEPDHMAAVTAFAVRKPRPLSSVLFGIRWAAGHGAAIVLAGSILLMLGLTIPDGVAQLLERAVGMVLIGLGAWTLFASRRLHAHGHTHADGTAHIHVHSHALRPDHDHRHGATAVGLLHGFAGTAPAVALIPLATSSSMFGGVSFLLLFAVGTAIGMGLYALVAGFIVGRAAQRSATMARGLAAFTGIATAAIGVWWLVR